MERRTVAVWVVVAIMGVAWGTRVTQDEGIQIPIIHDPSINPQWHTKDADKIQEAEEVNPCRKARNCIDCANLRQDVETAKCAWCSSAQVCANTKYELCDEWIISTDMCKVEYPARPSACQNLGSCQLCLTAEGFGDCAWCSATSTCTERTITHCPAGMWIEDWTSCPLAASALRCDIYGEQGRTCKDCALLSRTLPSSYGACAWCEVSQTCDNRYTARCPGRVWTSNPDFCFMDGMIPTDPEKLTEPILPAPMIAKPQGVGDTLAPPHEGTDTEV